MPRRLLIAPVSKKWAAEHLSATLDPGVVRVVGWGDDCDYRLTSYDSWQQLALDLAGEWTPDCLVLFPGNGPIPGWLWSAPIALAAWVVDRNLHWHYLRWSLRRCDLVLAHAEDRDGFRRAGLTNVQ